MLATCGERRSGRIFPQTSPHSALSVNTKDFTSAEFSFGAAGISTPLTDWEDAPATGYKYFPLALFSLTLLSYPPSGKKAHLGARRGSPLFQHHRRGMRRG